MKINAYHIVQAIKLTGTLTGAADKLGSDRTIISRIIKTQMGIDKPAALTYLSDGELQAMLDNMEQELKDGLQALQALSEHPLLTKGEATKVKSLIDSLGHKFQNL